MQLVGGRIGIDRGWGECPAWSFSISGWSLVCLLGIWLMAGTVWAAVSTESELRQVLDSMVESGTASSRLLQRLGWKDADSLEPYDPERWETVLNAITPQPMGAHARLAADLSANQLANIEQRLVELRSGAMGISSRGLKIKFNGQRLPGDFISGFAPYQAVGGQPVTKTDYLFSHLGIFFSGQLSLDERDDPRGGLGLHLRTKGLTAGVDERLTENLAVGVAMGYGGSHRGYSGARGEFDVDNYMLSLYGTYHVNQQFFVDAVASFSHSIFESDRTIRYTVADQPVLAAAEASPYARQLGMSLGGGYLFRLGESSLIDLKGRVAYQRLALGAFSEQKGGGLDLALESQNFRSWNTSLALRWRSSHALPFGTVVSQGGLEWEHQFNPGTRTLEAFFLEDAASHRFQVDASEADSNRLNLNFGLSSELSKKMTAYLRYETDLGLSDRPKETLDIGLRWEL